MGEHLLHGHTLLKNDAFADELEQCDRQGHDAQTADLNQDQNDALAEAGKGRTGIHYRQAGDADRGSGCKQSVDQGKITTAG